MLPTRSAAAVAAVILSFTSISVARTHTAGIHDNCTELNKKYPHGVGMFGAKDQTYGKPVVNFKRNNKVYKQAMARNNTLDRDKDKIVCEKV